MSDRLHWTTPRPLGVRGPDVTGLGLGCAAIGNLYTGVTPDDARATVDAAWAAGIRYFDTAPQYGHGLSEERLGAALRDRPRDQYVLSTKVGRLLRPTDAPEPSLFAEMGDLVPQFDFSRDGILRSLDESLERLGTDHIDVALLHDPDDHEDEARREAFPTLVQLRDEGVVRAIGCGMTQVPMLDRFVATIDLDCILLAGRYSLLDRSAGEVLLPRCAERGVGVILGGIFNSGILIDPDDQPRYDYAAAPDPLIADARRLRSIAAARGVSLPAAAVQFTTRHPATTTVLLGARSPTELDLDVAYATDPIDDALWPELDPAS